MPISSPNSSRANDFLSQAIAFTQLALDQAQIECSARHALAIKESRHLGLIDAVRWETRIQEALITLKGIRESPGMAAAVGGAVPAINRDGHCAVDTEPSGGDVMAECGPDTGETAEDASTAEDTGNLQLDIAHFQSTARDTPAGLAA